MTGLDRILDPWQSESQGDTYSANPLRPLELVLSDRATREVYEEYSPQHGEESCFILIDREGMLRDQGHLFQYFTNAIECARQENLILFNCRTGKAMRPVWYQIQLPQRTRVNMALEPVYLRASPFVSDQLKNKTWVHRLFERGLNE